MAQSLTAEIDAVRMLLKERVKAGGDLARALKMARRRLPRRTYRQAQKLVAALPLLDHPKLRLTLDEPSLLRAARELRGHLEQIDLKERRKSRILDVLASMAFAVLVVAVLLACVLYWRDLV